MQLWRSMMKLPQPVKGGLVAYLIVFGVVFLSVPVSALSTWAGTASPCAMGVAALGLSAIVLGVMLATDLRGSARAYAAMLKDCKPMGVDYSKSFFANPTFVRLFGAMFALVGIGFLVSSTIFASRAVFMTPDKGADGKSYEWQSWPADSLEGMPPKRRRLVVWVLWWLMLLSVVPEIVLDALRVPQPWRSFATPPSWWPSSLH